MSQADLDKRMYLAVQVTRMSEDLLRELIEGPDEQWHAPARKELERRGSDVKLSVYGNRLSSIE